MYWCVLPLYIFTRRLYFDSPYGTARGVQQYYMPNHLIRNVYIDVSLVSKTIGPIVIPVVI